MEWTASAIIEGLRESPYSLPDDDLGKERVTRLVPRINALHQRIDRVRVDLSRPLIRLVKGDQRVREIYESNAIEFLGPSLAMTRQVLESDVATEVNRALDRHALTRVLDSEESVREVLGLHGAKRLANDLVDMVGGGTRDLTESDMRSMHSLTLIGHPLAGTYRNAEIKISRSSHKPPEHFKVPNYMSELVAWINLFARSGSLPPVVAAAVAHAWLTHVHPFEDGNGRMARLIANMLLGSPVVAPLIVKHTSDRNRYLDALEHSDEAGDIALLVGLFARVLNRELTDLESPDAARRLFFMDIERRGDTTYDFWLNAFKEFLVNLGAELTLRNLDMQISGDVDPSDFERMKRGFHSAPSWVATVRDLRRGGQLQLWVSAPRTIARILEPNEFYPSILFARRPTDSDLYEGFYQLRPNEFAIREILVVPGSPNRTYVATTDRIKQEEYIGEGAVFVANAVADLAAGGGFFEQRRRPGY